MFARSCRAPFIVGYNTVAVPAGQTIILGVQFTDVGGAQTVKIADVATMPEADRKGAAALNNGSDQMWVWKDNEWVKYYYRKVGANTTGWCKQGTQVVTEDTVTSGQGIFFKRSGTGGATTLTLSGAVSPLDKSQSTSIGAGATQIVTYPWPTSFQIKDLVNCIPVADQKGAAALNNGSDQIWIWTDNAWTKYYFRKVGTNVTGWCKQGTQVVTEDTLAPGQGFFFKRSGTGGATTLTFPAVSAN